MQAFLSSAFAEIEPIKVMGLNYDDSSSLIYISTRDNFQEQRQTEPLRYVRLENPNRIYFDIKDACNDKSKPFGIIWKKAGKNGEQSRGTVAVIDVEYFYKLLTKN